MFGRDGWRRPLTVAVLVSGAVFLPQGVAVAAPDTLDGASCAQRHGCPPRQHDGADPLFIGPVLGSPGSPRAAAASSTTGSSVAGTATTGSATAGTAAEAAATSGVSGAAVNSGTTGGSGATDASASGSTGTGSSTSGDNGSTSGSSGGDSANGDSANGDSANGDSANGDSANGDSANGDSANGDSANGDSANGDSSNDDSSNGDSSNDDSSNDDTGSTSGSSGSSSSDDGSADGSSSSVPESSSSSATSSSAGSTAGTTSAGAAACPGTANAGASSSAADSATGSVTTGTAAPTTTAAASAPNATGAAVGTATSATPQALASTADTGAPVAGTALNAGASAAGTANLPADVIDVAPWYLTLPTGKQGSPDTVENPTLAKFTNDFFKLNSTRDGVVFSARGDGVTTKNSKYPRSELREMNGSEKAAWSNTTGSHTLDVCEAINKVPSAKPEVVGAQIHDAEDDVLQIRLEGQTLMAQYNDGKSETVIDPAYKLGTPYNIRIVAADGKVDVLYNGEKKAELPLKGSGWYWKVGAYVQSNTSKGDADSVGEVTVYSLKCVHA